jgi:hypothetical protein
MLLTSVFLYPIIGVALEQIKCSKTKSYTTTASRKPLFFVKAFFAILIFQLAEI